jgi:hypothetical protein
MSLRIVFSMIVFNGNYILDAILDTLYPFGYKIVIVEGPVGYYVAKGHRHSTDGTIELIRSYPDPEGKIHLVSGQWSEKDEMVNSVWAYVPEDTDFIWHVDDDECHYPHTIQEVIDVLETGKWDSISFRSWAFFGGFDRVFDESSYEQGFEFHRVKRVQPGSRWKTHRPPTICAIGDGKPWREHDHLAFFAGMPHYSYVWPARVKAKTEYYREAIAPGRCIPDYFDAVWLPWVLGDQSTRDAVEERYDGCHDFLPASRGPCRTALFARPHPPAIQKRLPALKKKFEEELATFI